jgi:hypothetical protein
MDTGHEIDATAFPRCGLAITRDYDGIFLLQRLRQKLHPVLFYFVMLSFVWSSCPRFWFVQSGIPSRLLLHYAKRWIYIRQGKADNCSRNAI